MAIRILFYTFCLIVLASCASYYTNQTSKPIVIPNNRLIVVNNHTTLPQIPDEENMSEFLQNNPEILENLKDCIAPDQEFQHPMPIVKPDPNTKIVMPIIKPREDVHYTMLIVPNDDIIEGATGK